MTAISAFQPDPMQRPGHVMTMPAYRALPSGSAARAPGGGLARRIGTLLLAIALSAGLTGRAAAHAHLQAARPAMGASVASAPAELGLDFSEAVNPAFSGATVTAPGGGTVPLGKPRSGPQGARTLVLPVDGALAPGAYRVDWHALAIDGHKTTGTYGFTIAP